MGHASTHDAAHGFFTNSGMVAYNDEGEYSGKFTQEPAYCSTSLFRMNKQTRSWNFIPDGVLPVTTPASTTRLQLAPRDENSDDEEGDGEQEDDASTEENSDEDDGA
jgi:hypothetical protein